MMYSKIDWISFTIKRAAEEGDTEPKCFSDAMVALHDLCPDVLGTLVSNKRWKASKGRKPYKAAFDAPYPGIKLYVHPRLDHCLFEFSGKGCDWLATQYWDQKFLDAIKSRLTRLDVAVDMHTETLPEEFIIHRTPGRFKSHGSQHTESGDTIYIGSRTSSRYACIYRYNPPHDRAHLLRSEFRMGKHDAEYTARAILAEGLPKTVKALGEQFGWKHPDWQPGAADAAILKVWRPERGKGKTMYWLNDTVATLLIRLHNEGEMDIQTWLSEHVLPKLDRFDRPPL